MEQVLLRRCGQQLEISADGVNPPSDAVIAILTRTLKYQYRFFKTKYQNWQENGKYEEGFYSKDQCLYYFTDGRLITMTGFGEKIYQLLKDAGYSVFYSDISPTPATADAYTLDWDNVYRNFRAYDPELGNAPGHFRPKQEEALQAIARRSIGIIDACTGFGKTFVFTAVCLMYPRAKIDIVVKPIEVAQRLARQLQRYIASVGMIGGGSRTEGRITIYTADSLHYSERNADFLLCDECHQLVAEKYFPLLGSYDHARIFGFTATAEGRKDGTDERIKALFGNTIFKLSYPEAQALGLVVPMYVKWLKVDLLENPAKNASNAIDRERFGIWHNHARNQIIANHINARTDDSQILVMCRTIEHALALKKLLPDFELCYAGASAEKLDKLRSNGLIPDDFAPINTARREQLRADFEAGVLRRAIATDVWATGVDFEKLNVLYRADARDSRIMDTQLPGRPARISAGKPHGEVVDCYDIFDKTFANRSRERRDAYESLGFIQDWVGGRWKSN
jgi:superfamily II DNA or RNA helicase